jgi:aspartate/methionine/tyrosine aminotransferase
MSQLVTSTRVRTLPRSGIREVMDAAIARDGVLRLDIGDPDFPTPAHIVEAAARAAAEGWTHYGPSRGLPGLRAAIAEKVVGENRFPCAPDDVVVTTGGAGAIFVSFLALLDPGDEVLIPDPGWPNYLAMASAVGAQAVPYPLDPASGFEPDLDELERLIRPRTRLLVVNSPSNPTGTVLTPEGLRALGEIAERHGIWLLSDECYDALVLEGEHVSAGAVVETDRLVTVFSFSKTYAMTGWRLGYAVAPPALAPVLAAAQEPVVSCPSTVAQKAAEAALRGPTEQVEAMRSAYRRRRDAALAVLDAAGVGYTRPRGAFYVFVDVGGARLPSRDLARRLLDDAAVAVVPGSAFGEVGEGYVRVSLAAPEETVREGFGRLARTLAGAESDG